MFNTFLTLHTKCTKVVFQMHPHSVKRVQQILISTLTITEVHGQCPWYFSFKIKTVMSLCTEKVIWELEINFFFLKLLY